MKKIIGLIVFVVVVIGGYFMWQEMQKTENTDDAEIDGNVVAISARVAGHVNEVLVEDGQTVKKGDVLVKLDPKDFEIAIERAKADLNNEFANLQSSRNDVPLTTATTSSTLNGAKSTQQDAAAAVDRVVVGVFGEIVLFGDFRENLVDQEFCIAVCRGVVFIASIIAGQRI